MFTYASDKQGIPEDPSLHPKLAAKPPLGLVNTQVQEDSADA